LQATVLQQARQVILGYIISLKMNVFGGKWALIFVCDRTGLVIQVINNVVV